jgi:hypothetical protein
LTDLEPPEPPETGTGGGVSSFFSNTRNLIGGITGLIVAISGLLIALNRVGILGDDEEEVRTETTRPAGLFGPMTRPEIGSVSFDGETMYVRASQPGTRLLHLADLEEPLDNVSMSARVSRVGRARDYGVAFICRYADSGNYYFLAVLSGGRYNIGRYRDRRLVSLTGGLKRSSHIEEDSNEITVRCVEDDPTTLTLEVNGSTVAKRQDANGIERGNVGFRVGSDTSVVRLRFEDFRLTYLE